MRRNIARLLHSSRGASSAEYMVIAGVMVLAIITILGMFGDRLGQAGSSVSRCINAAVRGNFGACGGGGSSVAATAMTAGGAGPVNARTGLPLAAMTPLDAAGRTGGANSGTAGGMTGGPAASGLSISNGLADRQVDAVRQVQADLAAKNGTFAFMSDGAGRLNVVQKNGQPVPISAELVAAVRRDWGTGDSHEAFDMLRSMSFDPDTAARIHGGIGTLGGPLPAGRYAIYPPSGGWPADVQRANGVSFMVPIVGTVADPGRTPAAATLVSPPNTAPGPPVDPRVLATMAGGQPVSNPELGALNPNVSPPAPKRVRPSPTETQRLINLINKPNKTVAEKGQILDAVYNRVQRRIEELKLEEAAIPDAKTTQKRLRLEALIRNLRPIDLRADNLWGGKDDWAYHAKVLGPKTIRLSEGFFSDLLAPPGDDQADRLEVWLGERAATLAHEYVHVRQWSLFKNEKAAYTETKEMTEIINDPPIENINRFIEMDNKTHNTDRGTFTDQFMENTDMQLKQLK